MIAYLFWHWPADPHDYEATLARFHNRLHAAGPPHLRRNASYRVAGAPWLPGGAGYEDWYLVDGFGDLDALNEKISLASVRDAHQAVAQASTGGAGGLYAVRSGDPLAAAPQVTWITKPRGLDYSRFYEQLAPTPCLLRRQLVLGPAPEFLAFGELAGGTVVTREPVFVSGGWGPAAEAGG